MARPSSKLVFYIPLFTALLTLLLLALAVYSGWLGPAAQVGTGFGEASRPGLIKQPVNTFSNLGFVFTGLLMGWCLMRSVSKQKDHALRQNAFFLVFFASLMVCVGAGSMAMHATESRLGGDLDMLSMYCVAAFLTAYAVERFLGLRRRIWFLLVFGAVVVFCVCVQDLDYPMPLVRDFGEFIFGVFVAVAALFEALNSFVRKLNHDLKWGASTLGVLLLAFLVWKLSLHSTPSSSLLQGHALWHLLCAVSAYCMFRYYASEKPAPVSAEVVKESLEDSLEEQAI